jgi:hypothetical protein
MKKSILRTGLHNWRYILFIICSSSIIAIISSNMNNGIFSKYAINPMFNLFTICLILLIFLFLIVYFCDKTILIIILIAFYIRVLCALIIGFSGVIPYAFDTPWDIISIDLLDDWNRGNFHINFEESSNVRYYTIFTTLIYFIFGYNPMYMQLINAFIGTLTVIYVYKISNELFNEKIGKFSALIMALWPTHIMFSTMQMRDSVAIFFLVSFVYYFIIWSRYSGIRHLLYIMLLFLGSVLIRQQNAALILISIFPFLMYVLIKRSNKTTLPIILISAASILVGLIVFLRSSGFFSTFSIDYIISEMNYRANLEDAGYLLWMNYSNWYDIIIYSPLRLVYFVYSPFPWQVSSLQHVLAMLESIVLIYFTISILKNVKYVYRITNYRFGLLFFVAFCIIGLTANAIVDANIGTAIRHKLQYIYLIVILFTAVKISAEGRVDL